MSSHTFFFGKILTESGGKGSDGISTESGDLPRSVRRSSMEDPEKGLLEGLDFKEEPTRDAKMSQKPSPSPDRHRAQPAEPSIEPGQHLPSTARIPTANT